MFRRVLFATVAVGLAGLPAASASDAKPKEAQSAFTAKLHPDILGIATDSSADAALAILEPAFKGRAGAKTDIQKQKFGGDAAPFVAALAFDVPATAKASGDALAAGFSAPPSGNRAFVVTRSLTFAQDQQPAAAEMIKQAIDKYGTPTLVGDQRLYYIYRAGKIVSVGAKVDATSALDAIARPLDPRAAIKLNAADGKGSCVAATKRLQAKDKTLAAMLEEAKAANCDGALSVQLTPGIAPDRVGSAQFTLLDLKRIVSAAAIDDAARAANTNAKNPAPPGSVPKL